MVVLVRMSNEPLPEIDRDPKVKFGYGIGQQFHLLPCTRKGEKSMSASAQSPIPMTRLAERYEVAENTMAFHFEKPVGWTFKAGQFPEITLSNPAETDSEGDTRAFSVRVRHTSGQLW